MLRSNNIKYKITDQIHTEYKIRTRNSHTHPHAVFSNKINHPREGRHGHPVQKTFPDSYTVTCPALDGFY